MKKIIIVLCILYFLVRTFSPVLVFAETSPTVNLNSPADNSTGSDTTPTLDFTGTDVDGNDIQYNVQIADKVSRNGTTWNDTPSDKIQTFSHTVNPGNNRLLLVGVSTRGGPVTSVTFGGVALTRLQEWGAGFQVSQWYLLSPAVTTANIVVTQDGWSGLVTGASNYYGVNQTTPFNDFQISANWGTNPSVTVSSAVGSMVADVVAFPDNGQGITPIPGAGQTSLWISGTAGDTRGVGSEKAGDTSVTMSWTVRWEQNVIAAVSIAANRTFASSSNPVAFDTSVGTIVSAVTSVTQSITIGNNLNRVLIVAVGTRGAAYPTSITFNGVALTQINTHQLGGDERTEMWYLLNPAVGAHNIIATMNTFQNVGLAAGSYYNVGGVRAGGNGGGVVVSTSSVTNTNFNSEAIIDYIGLQSGGTTPTVNAGQTFRQGTNSSNMGYGFADKLSPTANNTMSWSFNNNFYSEVNVILTPVSSGFSKTSSTDPGFVNPNNGADTNPFTSGANIRYTIQPGDTLGNGSYYWRVRGLDPLGSNSYGAWSSTRTFSISTTPTTTPTKVTFTNPARTLIAGDCNGAASALTLQLRDNLNNPANPSGDTVIRVTSNSPDYTIYSDDTCSTPVTNGDFTFTSSENTKDIYIIDYVASNWTLTAAKQSGPEALTGHTQNITVDSGALSYYSVSVASPQGADVCFIGTNTIIARDAYDNIRTQDTSVVNMTTDGNGVVFYSNSDCTGETTQYTLSSGHATMYIKTPVKQVGFTITATQDASFETGTSGLIDVDQAPATTILVKLPGQAFTDGVGISDSPINQRAGDSFMVDLFAVDANNMLVNSGVNNYTGNKTISFTNSVAGNSPDSTAPIFPSSTLSFVNGEALNVSIIYFNAASNRTVQADDVGTSITGTPSTTFTVDVNTFNKYELSASSPQTAGVQFDVTIRAADQWGNAVGTAYSPPSGTYIFTSSAAQALDTTTPIISTLSQGDFVDGVATRPVTLYKAEDGVIFTATSPLSETGTSSGISVEASRNISADNTDSTITGDASVKINTDAEITITLKDTWKNPIPGVSPSDIILSASPTDTIIQPKKPTKSNGTAWGFIQWANLGSKEVRVTIQNSPLVQNDGITPDADGMLDFIFPITVTTKGTTIKINGNVDIRGGAELRP